MSLYNGGASPDILIVKTGPMLETGIDIENNATSLGGDLAQCLNDFQDQYTSPLTPLCLRNTLEPYAIARRTELDKMVRRRQMIGSLLAQAANLHELNENMQKSGFANLYQNINSSYGSSTDSASLTNMQPGHSGDN